MDKKSVSIRRVAGAILILTAVILVAYQLRLTGPSDGIPRARRPLVLVTLDTLRADHLAPYGADLETPYFSRLAQESVLFERAFSVAPITLVAHTTMLTGLYPQQHGVRNNGIHSAAANLDTLAERLQRRGWRTAAFVSAAVLDDRYGLDQGFEHYDDDLSSSLDRRPHMVPDRPASATVDAALAWLDDLPSGDRFFLWLHLYDPHAPYAAPAEFRRRHPGRPYAAEVAFVDAEFERFMSHPRLSVDRGPDAPLVAVIGDHGESLGEHGEQTHALLAYDATLQVPFLLKVPGGPEGKRLSEPVGHVDLMPTLLDALGLRRRFFAPETVGRSLLPLLGGERIAPSALYSETYLPHYTYGWSKLKVLRSAGFKLIDGTNSELFELRKDPRELTNVIEVQPGTAHDLERDLRELEIALGNPEFENAQELDSESKEKLRSLGYLSLADPPRREQQPADPKAMVGIHVALEKARQLRGDRLFDLAEAQIRGAWARDPNNLAVLGELADNLIQQGRLGEAVPLLEQAIELAPSSASFYLRLAALESHRGQQDEALGLVDAALSLAPDMIEARIEKAGILQRSQRGAEARALLSASLEEFPDHARLILAHAVTVELSERDLAAAEQRLRRAVEVDPFLVPAWVRLGEVLEAEGEGEQAEKAYRHGLLRQPADPQLNAKLGILLARRGSEDAEGPLREALRLTPRPRSDLFMTLGAWLQARGRDQEAEKLYERWAEAELDSPLERNNQAVAYFGLGRLQEARTLLESLVAEHPTYVDALSNLASVAVQQEDWTAAEQWARKALEQRPNLVDGWNTLGLAQAGSNRPDAAVTAFEKALAIDAGYWQARLNLSDALLAEGDPSAAEAQLLKVIEVSPSLRSAHEKLAQLYSTGDLVDADRAVHHRKMAERAGKETNDGPTPESGSAEKPR